MSTDIRKARIEKGLSQDAAAALAGISGHRLARLERSGGGDKDEVDKILKAIEKAKAGENSRVGKGRPGGTATKKTAPAKKATAKKAPAKKSTSKRTSAKKTAAAKAELL